MTYKQALDFYKNAGKFRHEPTLERMRLLCRALGDPQNKLRFVPIAGTNGKGSCAAMLDSICRRSGMKTGLYTSPDLVDFSERIRVDGVSISHDNIARLTGRVQAAAAMLPPMSFFELVTALGFLYFAEQGCDIVILECGLGGRFDATNIIERPAVSVLMPIGLDHTAVLGGTLTQIAREKAGIIRRGCPVVCAKQEPEALSVIRARCKAMNAPLCPVDTGAIEPTRDSLDGQELIYRALPLRLPLLGAHQRENAAAAIEAARCLSISPEAIQAGIAAAEWPCRFEVVEENPPFILDGAHNPHGAAALASALRHYFPNARFCFILGVMADKDVDGILSSLLPLAERVLCVTPDSPRALDSAQLAARITDIPARPCGSLDEALERARASGLPCCGCGSLYFTGVLREVLLKKIK